MNCLKTKESLKANSQNITLDLYNPGKKTNIEPLFRAKLAQKKHHYPELEDFKTKIEDQHGFASLYSEAQKKLWKYRLVFLSFSLLFLGFSIGIHFLSFNFNISALFETHFKAKWLITGMTSLLTILSFACAYFPSALTEATQLIANRAKKSLLQAYKKKQIQHRLHFIFPWSESHRRWSALRHIYDDHLEMIREKKKQAQRLLKKISATPSISTKVRSRLYNQALAELHDKLCPIVQSFNRDKICPTERLHLS